MNSADKHATRIPALFRPAPKNVESDKAAGRATVDSVPMNVYFWKDAKDGKVHLYDLTTPSRPHEQTIDGPPTAALLNTFFEDVARYPEGEVRYTLPSGGGGLAPTSGKTKWYEWLAYIGLAVAAVGLVAAGGIGLGLLGAGASTVASVCFAAGALAGGVSSAGHLAESVRIGTVTTTSVVLDVAQIASSFATAGSLNLTVKAGSVAGALANSRYIVPLATVAATADGVQIVALTETTFAEMSKIQNGPGSPEDKQRAISVLLTQNIAIGTLLALSVRGARNIRAMAGRSVTLAGENGVNVVRVTGEATPEPAASSGTASVGTGEKAPVSANTPKGPSTNEPAAQVTSSKEESEKVPNTTSPEGPRLLGPGEDFSGHVKGSDGVLASLGQDGILDLYIKAGPDTPRGGEMFNEALKAYGSNVKGIRGTWLGGGDLASNFDSYKANVKAGLDPRAAAQKTFTGTMATRAGFRTVTVVSDTNSKVVVEFTR